MEFENEKPLPDALRAKRVLVIEDTPEFAQNALALENCKVTVAQNMKEAVQLLKHQEFDMVLSDLNFPTLPEGKPKRQDIAIAVHCLWHNLPLAVVTRGDPGTEQHIRSTIMNIHTFTPDDLVHCLAEHGFVNRYKVLHKEETVKFSILAPGNDVYFDGISSCTIKREEIRGQPAKTPEIWQKALKMLELSIAERQSKDRTFEKSGLEGKRVFVRQAGVYQGIPNARQKAAPMLLK